MSIGNAHTASYMLWKCADFVLLPYLYHITTYWILIKLSGCGARVAFIEHLFCCRFFWSPLVILLYRRSWSNILMYST